MTLIGLDHVQVAAPFEALAERLVVAGAGVTWDSSRRGVARFSAEDPWGNRLELRAGPDPEAAT